MSKLEREATRVIKEQSERILELEKENKELREKNTAIAKDKDNINQKFNEIVEINRLICLFNGV